jgi:hypothetical protein
MQININIRAAYELLTTRCEYDRAGDEIFTTLCQDKIACGRWTISGLCTPSAVRYQPSLRNMYTLLSNPYSTSYVIGEPLTNRNIPYIKFCGICVRHQGTLRGSNSRPLYYQARPLPMSPRDD